MGSDALHNCLIKSRRRTRLSADVSERISRGAVSSALGYRTLLAIKALSYLVSGLRAA